MPFDSTTYRPATADPLDLDAMIAWLETMPAEGTYDFQNREGCVICQRLSALGVERPYVTPHRYSVDRLRSIESLPTGWNWAAHGGDRMGRKQPDGSFTSPLWTYGAALSRFRALRDGV